MIQIEKFRPLGPNSEIFKIENRNPPLGIQISELKLGISVCFLNPPPHLGIFPKFSHFAKLSPSPS